MYNGRIFCILLTLTLAICMSFQAAEAVDEITLSTSNSVYYNGDHLLQVSMLQDLNGWVKALIRLEDNIHQLKWEK